MFQGLQAETNPESRIVDESGVHPPMIANNEPDSPAVPDIPNRPEENGTHNESVARGINEIKKHSELSGVLNRYIDWDYIANLPAEKVSVQVYTKGDIICDSGTLGQATYFILSGEVLYQKLDSNGEEILHTVNHPFEYFGEQAVLNGKTSNSRNTVYSPQATLLRIEASALQSATELAKENLDTKEIYDQLEVKLPEAFLEKLIESGRLTTVRSRESLVTEKTDMDRIFLFLSGSAFLLHDSKRGPEIRPGSILGDCEFFTKAPNLSSVITESECALLEITPNDFDELVKENIIAGVLLSQNSQRKIQSEFYEQSNFDPYNLLEYNYTLLDNSEQGRAAKEIITRTSKEIVLEIAKTFPSYADTGELERLFAYMCACLEYQESDNPKYFVSHGATHSVNVHRFANSVLEGSPSLRGDLKDKMGTSGSILLKLAAVFHDIGYPVINNKPGVKKWEHQTYSGAMVRSGLTYNQLKKIIPLSEEDYELFLESITHHGSDNPDPEKIAEGRPFIVAESTRNPLLAIIRIADNLDLISERLSKLQRDNDFIGTLEQIHSQCLPYPGKENQETRKILMSQVVKDLHVRLEGQLIKNNPDLDGANRIREIERNLEKVIELDDVDAYLHFKSVAIAQNIFVQEEPKKSGLGSQLTIGIEYNKPSDQLPLNLINWQTGRLENSYSGSVRIQHNNSDPTELVIIKIFPFK